MKRLFAFALALALLLGGCGWHDFAVTTAVTSEEASASEAAPQAGQPERESQPEAQPRAEPAPEDEPQNAALDENGLPAGFITPEREYHIAVNIPVEGGYAVVYEELMDDEFNRRFSSTERFWGLFCQLFDSDGGYIETIDYDRHNLYPITLPVSRVSCEGNYICFESRQTLNHTPDISYEMDYCFHLALNGEGAAEIEVYEPEDMYRLRSYYILAEKDGVSLQQGSYYDERKGRDLTVFRLVGEQYGESRIMLDSVDTSIGRGISDIIYQDPNDMYYSGDPLYAVEIELEPSTSQAVIKNSKVALSLDFAKCVASEARSYTEEMLSTKIAVSPDGKTGLWRADERMFFEAAGGCDYVLKHADGTIGYLYSGSDMDQVVFVGNDRVWANTFGNMTLYDAATGERCERQLSFDFGSASHPYNPEYTAQARLVVGIAADAEKKLLIAAHRPNTFGSFSLPDGSGGEISLFPVTLAVMDWEGNLLRQIETGEVMRPFGKFTIIPLEISCEGGFALLSGLGEYNENAQARINYLEN